MPWNPYKDSLTRTLDRHKTFFRNDMLRQYSPVKEQLLYRREVFGDTRGPPNSPPEGPPNSQQHPMQGPQHEGDTHTKETDKRTPQQEIHTLYTTQAPVQPQETASGGPPSGPSTPVEGPLETLGAPLGPRPVSPLGPSSGAPTGPSTEAPIGPSTEAPLGAPTGTPLGAPTGVPSKSPGAPLGSADASFAGADDVSPFVSDEETERLLDEEELEEELVQRSPTIRLEREKEYQATLKLREDIEKGKKLQERGDGEGLPKFPIKHQGLEMPPDWVFDDFMAQRVPIGWVTGFTND